MQELQIFKFENEEVRTAVVDEELWFFAQDVALILGYSATSAMMKRLDDDERMIDTFLDGTTYKKQSLISESGLFNAVLGSQLETAKRFKKWVTSEVLPAIRKTGSYNLETPEMQMARGLLAAAAMIEEKNRLIEGLQPKADALDRLCAADGKLCLRDAAKALKIPQHKLINWLLINRWLYRDQKGKLRGYSDKTPRFIIHKITPIPVDGEEDRVSLQAMVTAEGLAKLAEIFQGIAHAA